MDKKLLRKEMLIKRDNLSKDKKLFLDNRIKERLEEMKFFKEAEKIFIYVGFGSEINTIDFINDFLKEGKKIFIPRTNIEEKIMEAVEIKSLDNLEKDKYGILEPAKDIKAVKKVDLDLIILPGVVFDELGGRIGYGGGYYDKYLQDLEESIPKAALCYEFQIIDKVPTEEHDIRADYIITEKRAIYCKSNID
ncbi:MAG: 5-formyltetrahydrofolate cyclo-ligase [Clostridium sp.]|nr:5-formyltetrahydrofolate cyclo-ligase [Clostridium sp.]